MKDYMKLFWTKLQRITVNSSPAPSRGSVGHSGTKGVDKCHTRPARVAKRKAARLARRRNRA